MDSSAQPSDLSSSCAGLLTPARKAKVRISLRSLSGAFRSTGSSAGCSPRRGSVRARWRPLAAARRSSSPDTVVPDSHAECFTSCMLLCVYHTACTVAYYTTLHYATRSRGTGAGEWGPDCCSDTASRDSVARKNAGRHSCWRSLEFEPQRHLLFEAAAHAVVLGGRK